MFGAAWRHPVGFERVLPVADALERLGIAGFGWGVAWLDDEGETRAIRIHRQTGRFTDEASAVAELREVRSTRYLVHLRRPSKLSTVQPADTQPFGGGACAFCHNGYLERADAHRPRYAGRLSGRADSEVGWLHFSDRLSAGTTPARALADVAVAFGGHANLGYLASDGTLLAYAGNRVNALWRLRLDDAVMVTTALHSMDESVFDFVFPTASERERVPLGSSVVVGSAAVPAL
jgi:hypothetical protein